MNDNEATELLERLAAGVPVAPAPLSSLLRDGRRTRQHRTRLSLGAAAAVAVVVIPVALLAGSLTERSTEPTADDAVNRALADYDASRMPDLLLSRSRAAFSPAYPDLPDGLFGAEDEWNDVLPPEHYDKASWLSVDYRPTANQALDVWVGHETDPSGAALSETCANYLETGLYDRCDVISARGESALESTSVVTWPGDGPGLLYGRRPGQRATPTHLLRDQRASVDPDTLWFEHAVEVTHVGGYRTVVTESVKATTLEDADALFRVDTADLAQLAADPELVIPRPPLAANGCTWSLKDHGQVCVSSEEIATAEALVRQKASEYGAELTSATLRVSLGVVENPNTASRNCDSGKLLHIQLAGTFSRVVTTGLAPEPGGSSSGSTVHGVSITADAASGEACEVSVQTDEVTPDPAGYPLELP